MEVGLARGAYQFEFDRLVGGISAVDGEVWEFPTSTSVPKPSQKPTPPMWIAARVISSHESQSRTAPTSW